MSPRPITPATSRRRGEGGFSTLELIVVMVIIALLMAIALPKLFSARKTADKGNAETAALALGQAIGAFQLDHGGRVPLPGSRDWPRLEQGPVDLAGRPYLRPQHMTHFGDSTIVLQSGEQAGRQTPTTLAKIEYTPVRTGGAGTPAVGYRLVVYLRDGDTISATPTCQATDDTVRSATLPNLRSCR